MTARYTVESEDYDVTGRTRYTHTRYELASDRHTECLRRDWIALRGLKPPPGAHEDGFGLDASEAPDQSRLRTQQRQNG